MLRFLRERRVWLAAAFVALIVVVSLWVWALPHVAARAADSIADRFGIDIGIDDTSVRFRRVELRGVEVRARQGGLRILVDELDVEMSMIGALFDGADSIRRVSARGVDATIDLEHEGVADLLAKLGRRPAPPSKDSNQTSSAARLGGSGRSYEVSELTLRVADREGPLLFLRDLSLSKEAHALRARVEETLIGERDADHVQLGPWKLALNRDSGAWKLRELDLDGASVKSVTDGEGEDRALALRIRDALTLARPASSAGAAEADGDLDAGEPIDDQQPSPAPASARLFARLSPDAAIAIRELQIESRTSPDRVERIRHGEVTLAGDGDGWFRVVVAGETSKRATLEVDVSIMPEEARAEGSIELRRISLALIAPFVPELPLYDTEAGTVSAALDLEASASDEVAIEGGFKLRELALSSERIAPAPVEHINIDIKGRGVWHPDERRLEVERGQVRMGKAHVLIEGELERTPEHYRADLTLRLPPTDCNDVVGAIPDDVLGSLSRFEWSGNWSALTRIAIDSRELEATELSFRVRNLCQFEKTPKWVRVERFREPFIHRAVEPDETVFKMQTGPGTENWVAFADISPFVVPAVISHEDGGFYDHAGFAPWAIRDALVRNLQEGRYVVGASTISMQLAKNLYLQREKTIARKVQEVILTWWLENALTKDEILELYLNVVEYGPSVYGLRQAAAYYFGREPRELSPAEAAYLACMLPSPKRYHVSYERGGLTRSMKARSRRLLEHMAKRERIGPEALAYGLAELEDFHFWHEGDPPPALRVLPPLGAPVALDPEVEDPFEALFLSP